MINPRLLISLFETKKEELDNLNLELEQYNKNSDKIQKNILVQQLEKRQILATIEEIIETINHIKDEFNAIHTGINKDLEQVN